MTTAAVDNVAAVLNLYRTTGNPAHLAALATVVDSIAAQTSPETPNPALKTAVTTVLQSELSDADAATALSIPVDDVTVARRVSSLLAAASRDAQAIRVEIRAAMDNLTAA